MWLGDELPSPDGRRWLATGLSRSANLGDRLPGGVSFSDLLQPSTDAILVLEQNLRESFDASLESLWADMPVGDSAFIVLVPRRDAPLVDPYYEDPVTSFLCSPEVFARFLDLHLDCWPQSICYALLHSIARGTLEVDRLLVRQIPYTQPVKGRDSGMPTALLMPHLGQAQHLRTALQYIGRAAGFAPAVRVCLDGPDNSQYREIARAFPSVEFFHASPAPVGPYVIRQELAECSREPLLALQDSDDLPCHDRFTTLSAALTGNGCGMMGSHELCLDEIRGLVQPVRFPLDVSASLAMCPNYALVHGTIMMRRDVFHEAGGLSTHHRIANDTQFLLRSFFKTKIRNADEFLYVRRRHSESLTNTPSTANDNPLRRELSAQWKADFESVKRGALPLERSSLRPIRRSTPYRVERWNGHLNSKVVP